jgi:hypothetical protein
MFYVFGKKRGGITQQLGIESIRIFTSRAALIDYTAELLEKELLEKDNTSSMGTAYYGWTTKGGPNDMLKIIPNFRREVKKRMELRAWEREYKCRDGVIGSRASFKS